MNRPSIRRTTATALVGRPAGSLVRHACTASFHRRGTPGIAAASCVIRSHAVSMAVVP
ncbi:MAG: hypothetical protein QM757_19710 [Paludibaculum sp.]